MKRQKINVTGTVLLPNHDDRNHSTQADRKTATITKNKNSTNGSPLRFFLILICGIFASDALVEMLLNALPPLSHLGDILLDSTLLSILVFPLLYFFVFLPMIKNITKLKEAEATIRESEEKYRTLIENMGEGVGFINEKEIFVFANQAAEKIFGVGKGELTGLSIIDFLVGENIEIVENETRKRIQGISSVFEHEIVLKDGSKKNILAASTQNLAGLGFANSTRMAKMPLGPVKERGKNREIVCINVC